MKLTTALMNAFPVLILRSPLHRLMSGRYLLLSFTGKVSGRRYTVPVAYVEDGDQVLLSTDSRWWRNVAAGEPVVLRRGRERRTGTSRRVTDLDQAEQALTRLLTIPGYARTAGLPRRDGVVPPEAIRQAVAGERTVLAVTLDPR